jgi:predicted cobalt transporter CbtA
MDEETTPKKWYQSLGVTGGLAGFLASALTLAVSLWPDLVTAEDAKSLAANIPAAITAGAAAIGSILAIVGRIRARRSVTK